MFKKDEILTEEQKSIIIQQNIDQTAKDLQKERRRVYNRRYQTKHREEIRRRANERWKEKAVALLQKQAQEKTGIFEADIITAQDFDRFLNGKGESGFYEQERK